MAGPVGGFGWHGGNDHRREGRTAAVRSPPQTWPRDELAIDLLHKTTYGFVTGVVADTLASRSVGLGSGQRHAATRPGRHHDVAPIESSHHHHHRGRRKFVDG